MLRTHPNLLPQWVALVLLAAAAACTSESTQKWYRGNTHTHTLWSDGDAAPEAVVEWYVEHEYDWLSITDHDLVLRGERWFPVTAEGRLTATRLDRLNQAFGSEWVETRKRAETLEMRLKTIAELRSRFEEPGRFLLIEGQEISDRSENKPLHFNVFNLSKLVPAQGGVTVEEAMVRNLQTVRRQADETDEEILIHLNHPNYGWAVDPTMLASMRGTQLFEVYNGSTECFNFGDSTHAGMDDAWDIANTIRIGELGLEPLFGIANDDTHDYFDFGPNRSNPGRGWIMVRSDTLTADAILKAVRAGDFYSSTGVELIDVRRDRDEYAVDIMAETGVTYTTQFIGTRLSDGTMGEPGVVLQETTGTTARYDYRGDELYVRAKIVSSRMQSNPLEGEEAPEIAWTQPYVLKH